MAYNTCKINEINFFEVKKCSNRTSGVDDFWVYWGSQKDLTLLLIVDLSHSIQQVQNWDDKKKIPKVLKPNLRGRRLLGFS